MTLTDEQEDGLLLLKEFIGAPTHYNKYFLLKGYAGTGKTTLVNAFINWYNTAKGKSLDDLVVTAPTNKAVRVLRRMSDIGGVEYKTLHSLLGLKHTINDKGQEVYQKDKSVNPSIYLYGCVIVDEASMIDDEIFETLINDARDCKIIFVGDPCQIPPVNHFHSKPMIKDVQEELGIEKFELSTIIRQAETNPIITTSLGIRKGTFERGVSDDRDADGHGVVQLDIKDKERVYDLIKENFCGPEFANNPDFAKVIAWRNKTVDSFNEVIRSFLYYRGVNRGVQGEKLILNRPIMEGSGKKAKPVLFVNDDLVVTKVSVGESNYFAKKLKYYDCTVERVYDDAAAEFNIRILHEDSDKRYQMLLNQLKNMALSTKKAKKGMAWKAYYDFMSNFAQTSYNYAITCHKSQGSTYNNAFVCYTDIAANTKIVEMQRILYTAVTRPSDTLFIL